MRPESLCNALLDFDNSRHWKRGGVRLSEASRAASDSIKEPAGRRRRKMPAKNCAAITAILLALASCGRNRPVSDHLELHTIIPLPDVSGRIDRMAFDAKNNRLFAAAQTDNTVEVIDVNKAKRIATIKDLSAPRSALYLEEFNTIVVSSAQDGKVRFYDGGSLELVHSIFIGIGVDRMRYDPAGQQIFVGYGNGAIAVLDAADGRFRANFDLPGHPESFALESNGWRMFVNVPSVERIVVIDREKLAEIAAWNVRGASGNYPLALDEVHRHLFVGFRSPPRLVVLDADSGREITALDCTGDADDLFYDTLDERLYLTGGGGDIDVFGPVDADRYALLYRIPSPLGARTSLLVADRKTLYVAAPRNFVWAAEIREYRLR